MRRDPEWLRNAAAGQDADDEWRGCLAVAAIVVALAVLVLLEVKGVL